MVSTQQPITSVTPAGRKLLVSDSVDKCRTQKGQKYQNNKWGQVIQLLSQGCRSLVYQLPSAGTQGCRKSTPLIRPPSPLSWRLPRHTVVCQDRCCIRWFHLLLSESSFTLDTTAFLHMCILQYVYMSVCWPCRMMPLFLSPSRTVILPHFNR